ETVRSGRGLDALAASAPDVLAVVAYGELLPPSVLELPTVEPVNLHFSLLPELRGASPVQTALLRGMPETGVSTMVMAEGLDTGPVLLQARAPIGPDDDAGSLGARLAELGAHLLVETIDGLAAGTLDPEDQDETRATLAPRLRAGDRVLDWREPAAALVNLTRALAPEPAATTTFRDELLKVVRAEAGTGEGEPGTVVAVSKHGFGVAAGADVFFPLELAPAGRRRMSAAEFVRGHRPRIGERLG
ncbi:MAG TPA: methionyl-tRNA formyltransferase, partial [Actinomycetota bacterium]